MLVSHILDEKGGAIVAVAPSATLAEAAQVLTQNHIGAVLVLKGAHMAGILSERDIVRAIACDGVEALSVTVASRMSAPVETCHRADRVEDLMERMTRGRFRHMPVKESGRVVGIVSIGDVVKSRIAETVRETEALKEYIAAG